MPFDGRNPKYKTPKDLEKVKAIVNTPQKILGFSVPQQRDLVKKIHSQKLREQTAKEIWDFWHPFWTKGKSFEEKNLALIFWTSPTNYALARSFHKELLTWAHNLDNWAHSDSLSSLYSKFLEDIGNPIDEILKTWNKHQNPWLRRQSVVSLLYYKRLRKKTPPPRRILKAIEALLDAPEYYVQKGVGWTLREVYQVDPKLTMMFIERNLHKITPDAYSAAVEKVPLRQKNALRKRRAQMRKNNAR